MSSANRTRLCDISSRGGAWQPVKTTAPAVDAPTTLRKSRRVSPSGVTPSLAIGSSLIERSRPPSCSMRLEVTRGALGRRPVLAVAIHTITHVQRTHLLRLAHVCHVTMASGAGESSPKVRLVDEVHVVRHAVDADPVDRRLGNPRIAQLLELVVSLADGHVAEHALLHIGIAGVRRGVRQ